MDEATRVLVFDDEKLTAEAITQMAMMSGCDAKFSTKPQPFFTLVESWCPTVIALDLVMPDMDGVEVIEELGKRNSQVSLILTSGVGEQVLNAARISAEEHGLNILGILSKPFSRSSFNALLEQDKVSGLNRHPNTQTEPVTPNASALSEALSRDDQISVAYQPKVYCRTGTLAGFEALARWHHPQYGNVTPDVFIPLAEKSGMIDDLTRKIARHAIDWLAEISSHAHAEELGYFIFQHTNLSLNISAKSLANRELFNWLFDYLSLKAISPTRVTLELTESSAMDDGTASLDNLTRLRMQGFHLSIDDFGTGYSSMVQLVRLPFSEIKVDKSFVMNAFSSEESRTITRSIVDLGHSLQMTTTAEGVEDEETMGLLRTMDCEMAQGYLFSPPRSGTNVVPWFLEREQKREQSRLAALQELGMLDTPPEERFDRITRLAQTLFDVPISLITLVDDSRQWFKSKQGLEVSETARNISFCGRAIENDDEMVVNDAQLDIRFAGTPLVTEEPHIRFYAGHPLCLSDGNKVGTLCVIDSKPRDFDKTDRVKLLELSKLAEKELLTKIDEDTIERHTGLLTQDTFRSRANAGLKLCKRLGLELTFFSIQLRGLNTINSKLGEKTGDAVIREFGKILQSLTGKADLVGRYRNTRIAIEIIGLRDGRENYLFTQLQDSIEQWIQCNQITSELLDVHIGVSSSVPHDDDTVEHLIETSFMRK